MPCYLTVVEDLFCVVSDEERDGNSPDTAFRDAPLVKIIELFSHIQVVGADILTLASFLELFSVFGNLLARL